MFEVKGGPSQKLRGEVDHAGICTCLRETLKGKLRGGVMQKFSEIIKKPP